jgi:hypothetical protein
VKIHHQCGHWHKPEASGTAPPLENFLISVPLEMMFTKYFENESNTTWITTETRIDPADYSGIIDAWFEVMVDSGQTEAGHEFKLVDETGYVYATIDCTTAHNGLGRIREHFTLSAVARNYYVRMEYTGPNWCASSTSRAMIVLDIVNPTITRIQIPLLDSNQSAPGCAATGEEQHDWPIFVYAYCGRYRRDEYGYDDGDTTGTSGNNPRQFVLFKKDELKWDTIDHWDLEVIGGLWNLAEGRVALFNKTTNQMVAGSELIWQDGDSPFPAELIAYWGPIVGCHPLRKTIRIENNAVNFTNGDEFELRLRAVGGVDNWDEVVLVYSACLYATVTPVTKCEVYWRISTATVGTYFIWNYDNLVRSLYDPTKFSPGGTLHFEMTAACEGLLSKIYITDLDEEDFGSPEEQLLSHSAEIISGAWQPSPLNSGPLGDDILMNTEGGPLLDSSASIVLAVPSGGYIFVRAGAFDLTPIVGKTVYQLRLYAAVVNATQDTYWYLGGGLVFSEATTVTGPPTVYQVRGILRSISGTTVPTTVLVGFNKTDSNPVVYAVNQVSVFAGLAQDIAATELIPTMIRTRLRTGDILGAIDPNHRIITHYDVPNTSNDIGHAMGFLIRQVSL